MLFATLGWSVLWKTVQSLLSTGTQDLGHSFTRYGPPGRWITYLSLTCRRNTHIRTYPPTHTLSSFVVLCSKEHACTHWPPCNLWQGKIPLARLSQFQRARQKLWNVQFCSLFFQLQAMQKGTILEWSFFFFKHTFRKFSKAVCSTANARLKVHWNSSLTRTI